jgi:L-lactate dehydrogenase complex protein LldE
VRIGLFVTCLVDLMRPRIGFAALALLKQAGGDVHVPGTQTCCGQPGYNAGDTASARVLALKFLDEFEDCDYVVIPSGSCAGMVRVHYPRLFEGDPVVLSRIEKLSAKAYELTDFLANVAKRDSFGSQFRGTFTYHDSCSGLRELGVRDQPRALLSKVPGATLCEMKEPGACCGFGGTFSVKFDAVSCAIADKKLKDAASTGAATIVAGDLGCLLHLEGRLRKQGDDRTRCLHVAEVLAGEKAP